MYFTTSMLKQLHAGEVSRNPTLLDYYISTSSLINLS
jgi:hypothetical protein